MAEADEDYLAQLHALAPTVSQIAAPAEDDEYLTHLSGLSPGVVPSAVTQPSSPLRVPAMLGQAGMGAIQNAIGLPGTLGTAVENALVPKFKPRNKLEAVLQQAHQALALPTGEGIRAATGLGLENHPELAPRSRGEQLAVTGVEGAVGALPLMASGVGPIAALAGSEIPSYAAEAAKELGAPPWLTNAVGIGSAVAAGGGTSWVQKLANARQAKQQFVKASETLKLAQDLRTSGNTGAALNSAAETALSHARLAGAKRIAASGIELADAQAAHVTEATAAGLGTSSSLESAGKLIQPAARDWIEIQLPQKLAAVRNPLEAAVGTTTPTPITGLLSALENVPKAKLSTLRNNLPPRLLSALDEAVDSQRPLSWSGAMDLRSAIGDMSRNKKVVNDLGEQQAAALYAATTGDLGRAAKAAGAKDLFDAYNTEASRLYSFRDNVLGKIVSTSNEIKDKITPEQAAATMLRLARSGGTHAAALRAEVPSIANELGATALRTGAWTKLSTEAKQALLSDPMKRVALETALDAQAAAPGEAKALIAREALRHADKVAAEAEGLRVGNESRSNSVRYAQGKADAAAAKVPPKANSIIDYLSRHKLGLTGASIGSMLAGVGSNELAPWMLSHLGLPHSPAVAAGSAAGAVALPALVTGAKIAVKNPLVPAVGLLAGENALALPSGEAATAK